MKVITAKELMERPKVRRNTWGKWTLHENLTLLFDEHYEVDLEKGEGSAGLLDWIIQINGKTWCDARCMKDFVTAIEDCVNPQGTCCSFGRERDGLKAALERLAKDAQEGGPLVFVDEDEEGPDDEGS